MFARSYPFVSLLLFLGGAGDHRPRRRARSIGHCRLRIDTRGGSAASLRLKHGVSPRESRADGGKTAHYMVRWPSTRGEADPWSEMASATIGA